MNPELARSAAAFAGLVRLFQQCSGGALDQKSLLEARHLSRIYSFHLPGRRAERQSMDLEALAKEMWAGSAQAVAFAKRGIDRLLGEMHATLAVAGARAGAPETRNHGAFHV